MRVSDEKIRLRIDYLQKLQVNNSGNEEIQKQIDISRTLLAERAEHRTLVEAVRRKVSPVPCTCGMAGVSPCNRCSILLLLPQDSEEGGGE